MLMTIQAKNRRMILLVVSLLGLAGAVAAMTIQGLEEFKVSEEVNADQAVAFPVDI